MHSYPKVPWAKVRKEAKARCHWRFFVTLAKTKSGQTLSWFATSVPRASTAHNVLDIAANKPYHVQ